MKRKEIMRKLREAGFTFKEGGSHTIVYDPQGKRVSVISRQTEIFDKVARQIAKQTGVELF